MHSESSDAAAIAATVAKPSMKTADHAQPLTTNNGVASIDHEAYKILVKRASHSNVATRIRTCVTAAI